MAKTKIIDGQGVEKAWEHAGDALRQIGTSKPFLQCVSEQLLPGYAIVSKYGENPDIDGAFEDIWDGGGKYVPPAQARLHNVVSTLAADAGTVVSSGAITAASKLSIIDEDATFQTDGVTVGDYVLNDDKVELGIVSAVVSETELTIAGAMRSPKNGLDSPTGSEIADTYRVVTNASTGASIFYIEGLDASYVNLEEFVVTNGASIVATTGAYLRQFRARVFGKGTTGAEGIITATAQVDGTVSCQIVDGNNQTMMAIYTIPAGKVGYLYTWGGALSKKQAATSVIRLRTGQLAGIGYIKSPATLSSTGTSSFNDGVQYLTLPAGSDVWLEADASTADVGVSGHFEILLKDL